jgi:hypothetical protein
VTWIDPCAAMEIDSVVTFETCETSMDLSRVKVATEPCVACGCHLVSTFECNCGAVHGDYCENCGGFLGLDMWWSGRCTAGAVEHVHTRPFKPWPKETT